MLLTGATTGEQDYWHYAPRTEEERREQRKAARLALGGAACQALGYLSGTEGRGSGNTRGGDDSRGAASGRTRRAEGDWEATGATDSQVAFLS